MIGEAAKTAVETAEAVELVACPLCRAQLTFWRSGVPSIDACGFESYHLDCDVCGTSLGGVIDPADDTLLLSAIAA